MKALLGIICWLMASLISAGDDSARIFAERSQAQDARADRGSLAWWTDEADVLVGAASLRHEDSAVGAQVNTRFNMYAARALSAPPAEAFGPSQEQVLDRLLPVFGGRPDSLKPGHLLRDLSWLMVFHARWRSLEEQLRTAPPRVVQLSGDGLEGESANLKTRNDLARAGHRWKIFAERMRPRIDAFVLDLVLPACTDPADRRLALSLLVLGGYAPEEIARIESHVQ